jgi:hypothetical protein
MRRLRRRVLLRSEPRRPGDRGKGLDELAYRKRQVEELGVGQRGVDECGRAPGRLGEAIELRLVEPGYASERAPPCELRRAA